MYTPTFLLTWNPQITPWENYEDFVDICKNDFKNCMNWTCRSKQPKEGDRYILLMQGMGDMNGIIGYGEILGSPYTMPFGDESARFVDISVEKMWDYHKDDYVKTDYLRKIFPEQCFTPQCSGTRVKAAILRKLWRVIDGYT